MVYEFVALVGDGHPAGSRLGPRAAPHSDGDGNDIRVTIRQIIEAAMRIDLGLLFNRRGRQTLSASRVAASQPPYRNLRQIGSRYVT
jgi:hypothetical protein